ncbi:hypothetical protein [Microbacterium sp. NPDC076911]|uniref:hypothetical protein n=1 Tax=Microbacterium sp. NPDC076911 TaxID=3154958 RepID=UPI003429EEB2
MTTILPNNVGDVDTNQPPSSVTDRLQCVAAGRTLAPEHEAELYASAIPLSVAHSQGVHTATVRDELPADARWIHDVHGGAVLPAIVYPMVQPDGTETWQVKPAAGSVTDKNGRSLKYVSPGKDHNPPRLTVLREVDNPDFVLIVEGGKQALAALAWAPENVSIYRITGIWSWMVAGEDGSSGAPTPLLSVVLGHRVVIVADADAKTNINVFDGASALGEACRDFGASSVKFLRFPGAEKDGLDDALASVAEGDRRALVEAWIDNAKSKPADLTAVRQKSMRVELSRKRNSVNDSADSGGRVTVDVDGDQGEVARALLAALVAKSPANGVYNYAGGMVRVVRERDVFGNAGALTMEPLTRARLRVELFKAAAPSTYSKSEGAASPAPLSDALVDMVATYACELPFLAGIVRSPIVRRDGSICSVSGFDEKTHMILDLADDIEGFTVPEHPTAAQVQESVKLLRDDLFAADGADGFDSWPWAMKADQTHAIAGLVTPFLRDVVSKVPMLIFNGIHRGVGKGELISVICTVAYGAPVAVGVAPRTDDEMGKRLVSSLLAGSDVIVLDEIQNSDGSSRIDSPTLSSVLTSEIFESRKLGVSERLSLPVRATFFATGNNVNIPGDMVRRVYTCRLASDRADLETRDNFRHDLDTWVADNRAELLRAVLILIRAWFDLGQPEAPKTFGFKSFNSWQRVVGGILHSAGIEGFLSNLLEVRASADSETVDNVAHLQWLEEAFPVGTRFKCADVLAKIKSDVEAAMPYGMARDDADSKKLSAHYRGSPRWFGDLRIKEDGRFSGHVKAFVLERLSAVAPATQAPAPASVVSPGEAISTTDRRGFKNSVARVNKPVAGPTIAEIED